MLFLQFSLYLSSFVGTLKNEIPEAVLELYQSKIKQLSPDIFKFRTKQEDNPFTLNCSVVFRSFLFVFHAGSRGLGSNNSRNSSYKEKTTGSAVFLDCLSVSYDYGIVKDVNTLISKGMSNNYSNNCYWVKVRLSKLRFSKFKKFNLWSVCGML